MKSFGAWVALGVLGIGTAGVAASCEWNPLDPPSYEEAQQDNTGGNGGSGSGGAGTGGSSTGGGGAAPGCGDGTVKMGESCDDGNQANGDGCSAACQEEECWNCSSGTCQHAAANTPCNNGAQVCDGKGACGDCVPVPNGCDTCKNCGGFECDNNNDCASGACITGVCRSAIGSTCVESVECASNYCLKGTCIKCAADANCTGGSCDMSTGQCSAALSEPCDNNITCGKNLVCVPAISICKWKNNQACANDHECATNNCMTGAGGAGGAGQCKECMAPTDCELNVCMDKTCAANIPDGFYCVNGVNCDSGDCIGFPRKCAP